MEIKYKQSMYKDILTSITSAQRSGKVVEKIVITQEEAEILQQDLIDEQRHPMVDGRCEINGVVVEVEK